VKILIVDDSRAMQSIVKRSILGSGLDVETQMASSGQEALEMVKTFTPDVLLTDWHMPGMTGLQMVHAMRQKGLRNMYVGFITTETQNIRIQEALGSGANFVLNKPFDDAVLREKLSEIESKIKGGVVSLESKPVNENKLQEVVKKFLRQRPFHLREHSFTSGDLSSENLMALYRSDKTKALAAVGVLNLQAAAIISGVQLGLTDEVIQHAVSHERMTDAMSAKAAEFVREVAVCLGTAQIGTLGVLKQSMVSRDFAKLQDLLVHNRGQSYFRLDVEGAGKGHIGFMLV